MLFASLFLSRLCGLRCLGTSASPVPFQGSKGLVLHQPGAHRQMLNSHVAPGSSLGLPILRPARIKKRRTLGSLFPKKKTRKILLLLTPYSSESSLGILQSEASAEETRRASLV